MQRKDVAIVAIGRNEGDRLRRCLASIGAGVPLIYVDSGSSDGSADVARQAGARVVALDPAEGFTAARARNAGLATIDDPAIAYVQMIDGDCALQPGWIEAAAAALDADPALGAVFGRRRERAPEASAYNWMCDLEWAVPPGRAEAFGGDVMLRRDVAAAAGGYDGAMIAGEDIDFALRIGKAGSAILCLPVEMTSHDAALLGFVPWWRRCVRAGHAFAELAVRHTGGEGAPYRRSVGRIGFWGVALPVAAVLGGVAGLFWPAGLILPVVAAGLTVVQTIRMTAREAGLHGWRRAAIRAGLLTVGKYAEAIGLLRFHGERLRGGRAALIEYKGPER